MTQLQLDENNNSNDYVDRPLTTVAPPKLSGYDFWRSIGSPKYVCAPMVEQSELAFRMLCRKYGATLCYTPMFHSEVFLRSKEYREANFTTCPEDRPLIVQFCGNDPAILLKAAKMVEDQCDAIDINLGCPQGIARRGYYGSFLMENQELIRTLVETLHKNLKVPVTCKIRVFPELEPTLKYAKMLEEAGCQLLTVHGRTRDQKGHQQGDANLDYVRAIREHVKSIPIFSNGNTVKFEDVARNMEYTGCEGVMSAVGLLWNPALFSGKIVPPIELAREYIDFAERYGPTEPAIIKAHLFKILREPLDRHAKLRDRMGMAKRCTLEYFRAAVQELEDRENGTWVEPADDNDNSSDNSYTEGGEANVTLKPKEAAEEIFGSCDVLFAEEQ